MVTIKRYPNRKLYNTDTKKYITLDGISDLIRDGVEVEVVDHATGEDLTALTLSQILFEREKKSVSGLLPHAVLTGLVKAGGETLASLRRTLASPLKLLSQVDEEINRRITLLVQRGAIDVDEAERWRDLLLGVDDEGNAAAMLSEEELQALFARHGVPRREDLERLESQLEALAKSLENLTA